MTPDLTREEVDAICAGLKQNAAKARFLRRLGLHVERRPDGSPLVSRVHYLAVRGRAPGAANDTPAGPGPKWRNAA